MSSIFKEKEWLVLIVLSLLLTVIWFHSGLVKGGGEEGIAFYNPLKTYTLSTKIFWDYNTGFPTLAWLPHIASFFPLAFLYKYLHLSSVILQSGTFLVLLSVGSISVYFLTKDALQKPIPLISGIFYLLNPYSMSQIWARGLDSQFFAFALLPLALFLFLTGLRKKQIIYPFILSLCSVVFSSSYGITTFIVVYWSVLTVSFIFFLVSTKKTTAKNVSFYVIYFILTLVLWGCTNSNWLLPTFLSGSKIYSGFLGNPDENIGTLLGVSRNFTPMVLIRLLQETYFFAPSAFNPIYSSVFFQLISFLFPIFLFIGIAIALVKQEFIKIRLFVILCLLGLIVSLGANPPLGWLFLWVFQHIPFLQSFRNPYEKYGIVYALGYAPLFSLGLVYFFTRSFSNRKYKTGGILIVLFLLFGVYVWPMWTGRAVVDPDRKPGMIVPNYYPQLDKWLKENGGDKYRLIMTPIWPGDGAFYQWGSSEYIGSDPMEYLLDTPSIGSNPSTIPYFSEFMKNIRENIYKKNMRGPLSLLRTKYLVAREDAINITTTERNHEKFLTNAIYPPLPITELSFETCKDKTASSSGTSPVWIVCELHGSEENLANIKYLHVILTVDTSANIELALKDTNQNRPRWYGLTKDSYFIPANKLTEILIPMGTPTEVNYETNLSKVISIEVFAHPLSYPNGSVRKLSLSGIWFDPGYKEQVTNYALINHFGKLNIYNPINFNSPPEFGVLDSIETLNSFDELITKSNQEHEVINKHGFILGPQNTEKNLTSLNTKPTVQVANIVLLSDSKYLMNLKKPGNGLVILSKLFNPEWKMVYGVRKDELRGDFFSNIKLLKRIVVGENNHYVVNGYANLWKIDTHSRTVAVVFMPQILADIGGRITLVSIIITTLFVLICVCKGPLYTACQRKH